jgi:hypothetical protein
MTRIRADHLKGVLVTLLTARLEALDDMVDEERVASGKIVNRLTLIRRAIDEMLLKNEKTRIGWGFAEIPPLPMGKIKALREHGSWTTPNAAIEYAINSFLDRVESSLDFQDFERKLLRNKIQAASVDRGPRRGKQTK